MSIIRQFSFPDNTKITSQVTDTTNDYLWVAYLQNGDGNCLIQKQNVFSPDEIYFSLERAVTQVKDMYIQSSNLFVAYDDTSLLGEIISTTNPLTSTTEITRPLSIFEVPVAVIVNSGNNYIYFLLPGIVTGQNAKILQYTTAGSYVQTINLATVNSAASMTIDSLNDIWIVTNTNPAKVVRVYETSTNVWTYAVTNIT